MPKTRSIPSGEVDVAIIGAGAAGIAAGRQLAAAAPIRFVVLEGRSRLGGRAWTAAHDGFPLDLGCGWLHSADRNPWAQIAEAAGFTIDRTPAPWTSNKRDLTFSEEQQRDFQRASAEFYDRLDRATDEHLALRGRRAAVRSERDELPQLDLEARNEGEAERPALV